MTICSHIIRHRPNAWRSCWRGVLAALTILVSSPTLAQAAPDVTSATSAIDELVVTARKVEERVQDVPMSMQVLTAELLDVTDTTHLLDLQYNVPGLVINNLGLNGAGIALRGVADQGGSSVSVATHLNGVYLGSPGLSVARLFDLQRIEVLKGPQGTLYGRNATGGSINFIPALPQDVFSAAVETAWGSFDTARVQGYFNVPFDDSALRLAYLVSAGDGYIRNSVDDRRFGEQDFWGMRAAYRIDIADPVQLDIMAQHIEDDGAVGELWLPRPDYLADPSDIRLTTVTLADPFLVTTIDNADLSLRIEFGFASLHSISGYARSLVRDLDDCAGMPVLSGCIRSALPSKHEQVSQEFRLAPTSGGPFAWLAGLYFYDGDGFRHFYQFTPVINPVATIDRSTTTGESTIAAFGQASRQLAERWRITGGLRLNQETHRLHAIGSGTDDSSTGVETKHTWTNQSWRLDLEYMASDDARFYASVSTGFKSGGINIVAGGILDTFDPEHLTAYETGIKARWLKDRIRLNGAAFIYDFRDLQVYTATISPSGLIFETDNAAQARVAGIDIDVALQVVEALFVSAGVVWLPRREFVEYRNDATGDTLSGNKLARAPEWSTTAAVEFEKALRGSGRFSARLEYNYRSAFFYTIDNDPLFAQDDFGLINVYLRFEPASEKWYVFASGRNLGNADYFNQVFLQASPGYPDAYEAGFGYRF